MNICLYPQIIHLLKKKIIVFFVLINNMSVIVGIVHRIDLVSATTRVTNLHEQQCKLFRYSGPSSHKDTRSSVNHSNQVFYYVYKLIIYKPQQHSTILWYSLTFLIIIKSQPDIYSSLCIRQLKQAPDQPRTLP